jgi:hypothetical protein
MGSNSRSDKAEKIINERLANGEEIAPLYLCNPLANKNCAKTCCFWPSLKTPVDECLCYKTCFEEFAARDAEGNPIIWPAGEETLRKIKEWGAKK